jgi:hypothetical protein
MRYKVIAIDMDGTLLNSKERISEKNKDVIRKAEKRGIKIVLATGRIFTSGLHYAKGLGIDTPIISCNGGYVSNQDGSQVLYKNPIPTEIGEKVFEVGKEEGMYYHFYNENTFFSTGMTKATLKYYENNQNLQGKDKINIEVVDNPVEVIRNKNIDIFKITFIEDDKDKLMSFREKISRLNGIEIASSWYNNFEVMNEGVSKGTALRELCNILGVKKEEVVAIGDNENDISMFRFSGLSVAMKNGTETAKKSADVITDTNDENGVGNAIERYVSNN